MNNEIDLQADFITFRNQIINKFGEQYFEQTDLFFERAMAQAKQGLLHSAIEDGEFALSLSSYSKDTIGIEYLIGFISQIYCDLRQISKSKAYYDLGYKLINPDASDYEEVKEMYKGLKELIDGENWKGDIEDEPIE